MYLINMQTQSWLFRMFVCKKGFTIFFFLWKKKIIGKNRRRTSFIRKKQNQNLKELLKKKKRKIVINSKVPLFGTFFPNEKVDIQNFKSTSFLFTNELSTQTAFFVKSTTTTTCMPTENKITCHSIHPYKNLLTEVAIKNHFRVCVSTEEKEFWEKKISIFLFCLFLFPSPPAFYLDFWFQVKEKFTKQNFKSKISLLYAISLLDFVLNKPPNPIIIFNSKINNNRLKTKKIFRWTLYILVWMCVKIKILFHGRIIWNHRLI